MNHQLIDTWLHNPTGLTPEQTNDLRTHMETCAQCKRIYTGWNASSELLHGVGQVKAPTGFAARFQSSLADRRVKRHRRQVRIVLAALFAAILAAASIFLVIFFLNNHPIQVIGEGIYFFSTTPQRLLEFQYILSFWLTEIPVIYLIGAAMILSGWTFILMVSWVLTIFRITHQGVTP